MRKYLSILLFWVSFLHAGCNAPNNSQGLTRQEDTERIVLDYLSFEDLLKVGLTSRKFDREVEERTRRREIIRIYRDANGSFANAKFFDDPNAPSVRLIAACREVRLKTRFMREFWESATPGLLIEWLNNAPPELLTYGHTGPNYNCPWSCITDTIIPSICVRVAMQLSRTMLTLQRLF